MEASEATVVKTIDFLPCVLIEHRTDEVRGWTTHVLDSDLVTIGDSLKHTIEMAIEAAYFLVTEDLTGRVGAGRGHQERARLR